MLFVILILFLFGPAKSAAPATCKGGTLTDPQRELVLKLHNQYRSLNAKGMGVSRTGSLPPGKDIFELEYDCTLDAEAEAAAENRCGEGSAFTSQINSKMYASKILLSLGVDKILEDAVDEFYSPGLLVGVADPQNKMTDAAKQQSYANMMSSKNTKVGCSFRSCAIPFTHAIVTCKYDTQVNQNDVIYEPAPACKQDSDCTAPANVQAQKVYCDTATSLCTVTEPTTTTPISATTTTPAGSGTGTAKPTTGKCPNPEMTDNARNRIVALHNNRRRAVANGNVKNGRNTYNCPKAANMFEMVYNCDLEASALSYAKQCSLTGSDKNSRPGQGENFYVGTMMSNKTTAAEMAMESWWAQISMSGINKKMTFLSSLANKPKAPLFFTQMVWALSTRIGCAVVDCPPNTFTVCRYAPAGNILDQQIYQVGRPCSTCSPCLGDGLCRAP